MQCQDIQTNKLQSAVAQLKDRRGSHTQVQILLHKMILAFVIEQGLTQVLQALLLSVYRER